MLKKVTYREAMNLWKRPSRIVLAVSGDERDNSNIIVLGWKMQTSIDPPMVAISVGKTRYSHSLLLRSGEFVLAIPGGNLAEEVFYCGTHSGRDVDKFKETNLTAIPASKVKPPLIKECIANIECKIVGNLDTGDHTIFVGEVQANWVSGEGQKNLLSIGQDAEYKVMLDKKGRRFGVM